MKITRRGFIASAILPVLPLTSIVSAPRDPFLSIGDSVSFLYFEDWNRPLYPCTISAYVEAIGEWNGDFFPVVLSDYRYTQRIFWDGSDAEWCMFPKEVPDFNWGKVDSGKYPNIHSYVREKRFGEDPSTMRMRMDENFAKPPPSVEHRGYVPFRTTVQA